MRFGFLNNFADLLAAPVSDTATSIELAGKASDIQTALQSADAVALTLFVADDQGNETQREVVYATAATPPLVTVTRAQEGTTAVAFAPGDGCEGRLTAGVMGSYSKIDVGDAITIGKNNLLNLGESYILIGNDSDVEDVLSFSSFPKSIALGDSQYIAGAAGEVFVVLGAGNGINSPATKPVLMVGASNQIGSDSGDPSALGFTDNTTILGHDLFTGNSCSGINLGSSNYVQNDAKNTVCIGKDSYITYSANPVQIGAGNQSYGSSTNELQTPISIGSRNDNSQSYATCIGDNNTLNADYCAAIGDGVVVNVKSGFAASLISFLTKTPTATSSDVTAAKNASQQVVIASQEVDLTSVNATATITLPANTILLPDAFDVVVVASSGAGGTPEIQIGPDDVTPASYLAATPVTKTVVGGRDTFTPLVTDGVTSLRVSVATAGTGTAYSVKVVVRGYVMEV